jgi:hypothetical protein
MAGWLAGLSPLSLFRPLAMQCLFCCLSQVLELENNRLEILPDTIGDLPVLLRLDLSNNSLRFLPNTLVRGRRGEWGKGEEMDGWMDGWTSLNAISAYSTTERCKRRHECLHSLIQLHGVEVGVAVHCARQDMRAVPGVHCRATTSASRELMWQTTCWPRCRLA